VDIRGGSSGRERQKTVELPTTFLAISVAIFCNFAVLSEGQHCLQIADNDQQESYIYELTHL